MKLTVNFYLEELVSSDYAERNGINNTPTPEVVDNITKYLAPGLQRVRYFLGSPVIVSSGYRSPKLNILIGGASTSQHVQGLAADFTCPGYGDPKRICQVLSPRAEIGYDQLIYEGTWVHISFAAKPRRQVLTARFDRGRVTYTPGIT